MFEKLLIILFEWCEKWANTLKNKDIYKPKWKNLPWDTLANNAITMQQYVGLIVLSQAIAQI